MLRSRQLTPDYSKLPAEVLFGLCADGGKAQAWEEFLRRYHGLILAIVVRTARRYTHAYADVCEDLAQDVYLKLAAQQGRVLREFEVRQPGSEYSFLTVMTVNVVHDHFKKKDHCPLETDSADNLAAPPDPGSCVFEREVADVLRRKVRESEQQIFWLYYRLGMTAKEIASIPSLNLTIKGVESVLVRLRAIVREELAKKKKGNPEENRS